MTKDTKISIIIPFYNAKNTLRICLESLSKQTYKNFEIIAVDNNSTDGSEKIVKELISNDLTITLSLFSEKKQGPAAARNRGVLHSKGEIIAFLDADCIADNNWLADGFNELMDEDISGIGGKILPQSPVTIYEKFSSLFTTKSPNIKTYNNFSFLEGGGFLGCNLMIRREIFLNLEGFDENFKLASGEDFDLCIRLYKAGYKLKAVPSAIVYHKHRTSFKNIIKQAYQYGLTHPKLLIIHFHKSIILEIPALSNYQNNNFFMPIWIDAKGADKKLLFIIILSTLYCPFLFVLPIYYFYLIIFIIRRLKISKIESSVTEKTLFPFLLIIKSFSLTIGRFIGGIKNGCICI